MGVFLKPESWFSQAFLIGALGISIRLIWASLVAQRLKHLPTMRETRVPSLGQEDPLEKEMVTPFQYSCLENPMDREAWWATVQGVAKNWTGLSIHTHSHKHSKGQKFPSASVHRHISVAGIKLYGGCSLHI